MQGDIAARSDCPCGSGRPFDICHGAMRTAPSPSSVPASCPCGSGKPFAICHGTNDTLPPLTIVSSPTVTRQLDLACGQTRAAGHEGVDIWEGAQHRQNLCRFPWIDATTGKSFEDNSIASLRCSHFIEHIPTEYVDAAGNYVPIGTPGARDLFLAFFDECYRILVPDGNLQVLTPCARNNRAFQDPTHRRFIVMETFLYLSKTWREANKLDHYHVQCDFDPGVNFSMSVELSTRSDEVKQQKFTEAWNVIGDWDVLLKSKKPALR
jgi:predicted SAM-dependent methyltransferase